MHWTCAQRTSSLRATKNNAVSCINLFSTVSVGFTELRFDSYLANTSHCLKTTTYGLEIHFLFPHHTNAYVHIYDPNERMIMFCMGIFNLELSPRCLQIVAGSTPSTAFQVCNYYLLILFQWASHIGQD